MAAFDLPIQTRGSRLDVNVTDAFVEHVPMELLLEFGAVIGLYSVDAKGQSFAHVVEELNGGTLVVALEDLEDS